MGEFTDSLAEGFTELFGIAGSTWVRVKGDQVFSVVEGTDTGNFDYIAGGQDFKRNVQLLCSKADFPTGIPAKGEIILRQDAPKVKYRVSEDTGSENDTDPTFTLKLELKLG